MLNNTYSRTADNDARREYGRFENEAIDVRIDRMQYVERSVRSNQVAAEHQFGVNNRLDWAVTSSGVTRDEPDRSEFVYVVEDDGNGNQVLRWHNSSDQGAVRTFSNLAEDNLEDASTTSSTSRSAVATVSSSWAACTGRRNASRKRGRTPSPRRRSARRTGSCRRSSSSTATSRACSCCRWRRVDRTTPTTSSPPATP